MVDKQNTLSSAEFSTVTGIPVATVNQMLRQGKLRGEKRGGRWAIFQGELQSEAIAGIKKPSKPSAGSAREAKIPNPTGKQYDVETFARMTYLTENGVRQWLKTGRLSGGKDASGNVLVDAANLDRSDFQHLIRH